MLFTHTQHQGTRHTSEVNLLDVQQQQRQQQPIDERHKRIHAPDAVRVAQHSPRPALQQTAGRHLQEPVRVHTARQDSMAVVVRGCQCGAGHRVLSLLARLLRTAITHMGRTVSRQLQTCTCTCAAFHMQAGPEGIETCASCSCSQASRKPHPPGSSTHTHTHTKDSSGLGYF